MKIPTFFLIAVTLSTPLSAQIFKCQVDGKTTFTDKPCAADAESEIMHIQNAPPTAAGIQQRTAEQIADLTNELRSKRKIKEFNRDIETHEDNIKTFQKRMSSEISVLQRKKLYANNNLAGATWENSISSEIDAVVRKYESLIGVEQKSIDRLRESIASLQ